MRRNRLLILGWDAAEWELLQQFRAEGLMPHFDRLYQGAAHGQLASLQPVLSPCLWSSIATGKRPHQHGILGFVEWDEATGVKPVSSRSLQAPPFWRILEQAGLKTSLINWWPSQPVEELSGLAVSNHFCAWPESPDTWPLAEGAVHPSERREEMADLRIHPSELTEAHLWPFFPEHSIEDLQNDPMVAAVAGILARSASVHNVLTRALEDEDWDCLAVYQEALDQFSHLAMKYHPPRLADIPEADFKRYQHIIRAAYRWHDMMLGRILELLPAGTDLILLSDHGFQSGMERSASLPDIPASPALEHQPYGVFLASGPNFKAGQIAGLSLLDIFPTILHYFKLPVGEDLEGKVPAKLFTQQLPISKIPSWSDLNLPGKFLWEGKLSTAGLADLEALGYIQIPASGQRAFVQEEQRYNRALSLWDAHLYSEAQDLLPQDISGENQVRWLILAADLHLKLGQNEAVLQLLPEDSPLLLSHYFRALAFLQLGKPQEALALWQRLEEGGLDSVQLQFQMARAALMAQDISLARELCEKLRAVNPRHAGALNLLAQIAWQENRAEEGLALAEESLALRPFQPHLHYLKAHIFNTQGKVAEAHEALALCLNLAPKHQKALHLKESMEGSAQVRPKQIIVSGFPRSGTSLMMALLQQGGFKILSDGKRATDHHNPKGYYEWEGVKSLAQGTELPMEDKLVIKVVAPLLPYLPNDRDYKVIWMHRPTIELILSQAKMKGEARSLQDFPFAKGQQIEAETERLQQWLNQQPHLQWHRTEMPALYGSAAAGELQSLNEFLGSALSLADLQAVLDPQLRRNRID